MDEKYDVIILGTGLKECILSGVLSVEGKKVLHMDRNSYYGGESASLNLNQLYEKFKGIKPPAHLGPSKDWNIDLIPKFIMAAETLVQILIKTDVTRYFEFKLVDGSFVLASGKIYKIPSDAKEAFKSPLLGIFEKRKCGNLLEHIGQYDQNDPKTWKSYGDLKKITTQEFFQKVGFNAETIDFLGHGMALRANDSYLLEPAFNIVERIRLYGESISRYGSSPYIYPLYGLGELPQGFSRLSAIYGGTYMLNKPMDEIICEGGKFVGVKSEGEVVKADMVIGDPSYFPNRVKKVGQVVRCIVLLNHPIPKTEIDGKVSEACQIIVTQKEAKRKNDIYISCVSSSHCVAPKGKFIAMISTVAESDNPKKDIEIAMKLLGEYSEEEVFISVTDLFEPLDDGKKDQIFISKSFDAETFFSTSCDDILDIYRRITGKELDLTPPKKEQKE